MAVHAKSPAVESRLRARHAARPHNSLWDTLCRLPRAPCVGGCSSSRTLAETVSRGLRSKRISRGRKQDTEATSASWKRFNRRQGGRYIRS